MMYCFKTKQKISRSYKIKKLFVLSSYSILYNLHFILSVSLIAPQIKSKTKHKTLSTKSGNKNGGTYLFIYGSQLEDMYMGNPYNFQDNFLFDI